MSAPETTLIPAVQRTGKQKNAFERAALIAAVASGMTQEEAAQHFGVHRNTVQRWCAAVRQVDNAVNPLRKDWQDSARTHAIKAVENGLKCKRDPYKAANIGVKVLEGLGELQTGGVQVNNTRIVVSWISGSTQEDTNAAQSLPVSPLELTDKT